MGFKIKRSILAGTSGHKKATDRQIKINRAMDNSSLPDGRAKSSAFQLVSDEDKKTSKKSSSSTTETWQPETSTSTTTDNDDGTKKTIVKKNQKGTSTTVEDGAEVEKQAKTPAEIAAYNKYLQNVKEGKVERNTKYDKKTTTKPLEKNSSSETNTEKKEPKKCECQTYKADGSKGPMVKHECGSPNPNCSKRPTTKTCSCTPKGGEPITYDCGKAKPAACASKGSSTGCPDSKRENCPGSSWSWKKCRCNKKTKAKEVKYKKRCYKGKNGSTECSDFQSGGAKKSFFGS